MGDSETYMGCLWFHSMCLLCRKLRWFAHPTHLDSILVCIQLLGRLQLHVQSQQQTPFSSRPYRHHCTSIVRKWLVNIGVVSWRAAAVRALG